MNIFTAVKNRCIFHGRVCIMEGRILVLFVLIPKNCPSFTLKMKSFDIHFLTFSSYNLDDKIKGQRSET